MNNDILTAREKKLLEINEYLSKNHVTVLVKANIPGLDKNIPEASFLVNLFSLCIQKSYEVKQIISRDSVDGPYDIITVKSISAHQLKRNFVDIENNHALGRLIDLDVFDDQPISISRSSLNLKPRKCYVCHRDAHICSRSKRHSIGILLNYVTSEVKKYLLFQIEKMVQHSMMIELNLNDKFGLVCKDSNGSHDDMDYHLMVRAQNAILPYFVELFSIGYESKDLKTLLEVSRPIGIKAEEKMLEVTLGVNAYKGLIFILGLSVLSLGYTIKHQQNFNHIFENMIKITHSIYDDFEKQQYTAGITAYKKYQIYGIRGEVMHGMPSVKSALLLLNDESDDTLRNVLKTLILISEDTVFLKRAKSLDSYHQIKKLFKNTDISDPEQLKKINQMMIDQNLSFGGSADLLIVTIFLKQIKMKFFK